MIEAVFTGAYKSKIVTTQGIYFSKMSSTQLLGSACIRFASTLEGRIEAIKKLMNYPNKTPVLIEPKEIGAFPTMSYKNSECVWIFNHPFRIESLGKGKSKVTFHNGMSFILNTSKDVLLKQQQRLHTAIDTYRITRQL